MHAIVVTVQVDPGQMDVARSTLQQQVVPRVSSAPGFVTGYWLGPVEGRGMSVTLWVDEQAAQAAAAMIRSAPTPPGVTLVDVQPREVLAHA
jgi:hypothetical protein